MTRVLLFGGSGFIGRHVRQTLVQDPRISAVDCPGRQRHDLIRDDVAGLTRLVAEVRPDAVVNCTGQLVGSAYELAQANTAVTAKLIDAVAAVGAGAGTPGIRLVRLGSAAEYGQTLPGHPVTEQDTALPVSAYGVCHLAGTHLVELASAAGQVDGAVLRTFNPIGPGMHEANLLGRAAAMFRRASDTAADHVVLGRLGAYRDFVDVRDVAAAVAAAVLAPALPERVFNVGSGHAVTARHAVTLLAAIAGFGGEIREDGHGPTRSAAVGWISADISRAARVLGWAPAYDLADSLKAVWAAEAMPR